MDISQLFSLFNQNQQNLPNQQNTPQQPAIPQDVLNSYPTTYIDSPTSAQKVQSQSLPQASPQQPNQNQPQNPMSMLMNILPSLFKGNFDISSLMNMLGGGKANILSNLLGGNKLKSTTKKAQQKNSPNYDEFKKVNEYEFDD